MYNISVFISHSWAYSEHYNTLSAWIFGESWNVGGIPINFHDTSVPKENAIDYANSDEELRNAIYARIRVSDVVLIPTGMYIDHSNWIQKELEGSFYYKKPILAVSPWAQEKKASIVASAAKLQVGWSKNSVVTGIWRAKMNNGA
ncbi:TIR domain-containing protein [Novosphingobium ginsenosidimutans]|uniref:Nuclease n=1 Tax=Novosphingobium ginsenosidimutans TaxID=1176536 RepID=A0A5B8S5J1_9SPHN|nr:TIR domain-containing protein [Novosphingobium ginsenosidimutans]QEA16017.1 nuclease [Novosphingobium ginsenosidimutans]